LRVPSGGIEETNMSDKHAHGATTIRANKDGGGGKWLLGALGAAILVGGGYFVWQNMTPGESNLETAYTDTYSADPLRAGPLGEDEDTAAQEDVADEAMVAPASANARGAPARRNVTAQAASVPEETIGVTPANYSTSADSEELVVTARRPIWARTPSARRLSAMYPDRMLERGREGEARLACVVQDGGVLNCERIEETPGGFGPAAVRVARAFRHSSQLADGSDATGTPVNLRVVFRIAEDEQRRG